MSRPSESSIERAVAKLHPDGTVTDITPIESGKNAVYAVSFETRDAILKVGTASPERVRAEPAVVRFVRKRTGVPVPSVLQVDDEVLAYPCCLFERVPGRTVPDRPDDLGGDVLRSLCEDGGRHLAGLHQVTDFETFGPLVPGGDGVQVEPRSEEWPSFLGRAMTAKIGELGDRFEQARDTLLDYADSVSEGCREVPPCEPVLVHMDYRPANVVFDPGAPSVTRAVIDWGGAAGAPAAYEVAHAELLLTDWPHLEEDTRAELRDCFRAGYTAVGDAVEVPPVYEVDARLRLMKHLEMEVGHRDRRVIQSRVGTHRQSLQTLGVL